MNTLVLALVVLAVVSTQASVLFTPGAITPVNEGTLIQGPSARATIVGPDGGSIVADSPGGSVLSNHLAPAHFAPALRYAAEPVAFETAPVAPVVPYTGGIYTASGRIGALPHVPFVHPAARYALPTGYYHTPAEVIAPVAPPAALEVARSEGPVVVSHSVSNTYGLPAARYITPSTFVESPVWNGLPYW